jgi:hypothetical protein
MRTTLGTYGNAIIMYTLAGTRQINVATIITASPRQIGNSDPSTIGSARIAMVAGVQQKVDVLELYLSISGCVPDAAFIFVRRCACLCRDDLVDLARPLLGHALTQFDIDTDVQHLYCVDIYWQQNYGQLGRGQLLERLPMNIFGQRVICLFS